MHRDAQGGDTLEPPPCSILHVATFGEETKHDQLDGLLWQARLQVFERVLNPVRAVHSAKASAALAD